MGAVRLRIIGLKELPALPMALRHRHIYFGHAYKRQQGAHQLLRRFVADAGALLDLRRGRRGGGAGGAGGELADA